MKRMFWNEFCWLGLLTSFSMVGVKATCAVPGGSPMLVPIPGLVVAPKADVVPVPNPPLPPPNKEVPVVPVAGVDPKVVVLLPTNKEEPPPKGDDVEVVFCPNPPEPKPPLEPAVAVVEPKRPPPLVVVVPKAGFAAPKPPLGVDPKAPIACMLV